jgi:uncharacterized protein (TIGR03000 family)
MYSVVLLLAMTGGSEATDCHKSHGCTGSCYGSTAYVAPTSYGCCGSTSYGCCGGSKHSFFKGHKKSHGCCGGSCYGSTYGCCGGVNVAPAMTPPAPEKIKAPVPEKKEEVAAPAAATIIVTVAPAAKLTIDGAATMSTAAVRVFETPILTPGRDYSYTLEASIVREGKPVVVSREVTVRAGQQTKVSLTDSALMAVVSR